MKPASYTTAAPGRLAAQIRLGLPDAVAAPGERAVGLIGLADDTGVAMNGGRPGARHGPAAFRAALSRYGVAEPMSLRRGDRLPAVFDLGDLEPGGSLAETHDRAGRAVESALRAGLLPVGIGGGHDLTFPFVRAVMEHRRATGGTPLCSGLYADAHLDVRPEEGSGMPFRALIERAGLRELVNVGAEPLVNTRAHYEWMTEHGGRVAANIDSAEAWICTAEEPCFVSLDLDVLDAAHAPGVSAINPNGFLPRGLARLARAAGQSPQVACFDVMELNPAFDQDGRTARIAAYLFLAFLAGLAERPADRARAMS